EGDHQRNEQVEDDQDLADDVHDRTPSSDSAATSDRRPTPPALAGAHPANLIPEHEGPDYADSARPCQGDFPDSILPAGPRVCNQEKGGKMEKHGQEDDFRVQRIRRLAAPAPSRSQ